MKDLLDGKRIALIGNSEHLSGLKLGNIIDSYDIVVRLNKFNTKDYQVDVGSKTDIWATCLFWQVMPDTAQFFYDNKIKGCLITLPPSNYLDVDEYNKNCKMAMRRGYGPIIKNATIVDCQLFETLCDFIGNNKRPNTGTLCFHWLLKNIKYKEIYLAGFSLGMKKWHYNQPDYGGIGPGFKRHDPLKEASLIVDHINDNIKVDPFMEKVIHENIHKHKT